MKRWRAILLNALAAMLLLICIASLAAGLKGGMARLWGTTNLGDVEDISEHPDLIVYTLYTYHGELILSATLDTPSDDDRVVHRHHVPGVYYYRATHPQLPTEWIVSVNLWLLAGITSALPIIRGVQNWRRWCANRMPANHCRGCGYDLTGNVSGVCPECGQAVEGAV